MRLVLAAIAAVLLLAAPAGAKTLQSSSGDVRATATWQEGKLGPRNVRLQIFDAGEQIVDKRIPDKQYMLPIDVEVLDLDNDGEPETVFSLYSGGAHCCVSTFTYQGTKALESFFGNVGYVLEEIGDVIAYVSADDRFAYRYASYAGSLFPLFVQRFEDGELVDITRDPALRPRLKKEAARFKKIYDRAHRNQTKYPEIYASSVAAYTADMCSLGDCDKGYALARKAADRGEVKPKFALTLARDMAKLGYERR